MRRPRTWLDWRRRWHLSPLLLVTADIAVRCAVMRDALRRRGTRARPHALNLLIAATAIEYDLTLVTHNVDDYAEVPGLRLISVSA